MSADEDLARKRADDDLARKRASGELRRLYSDLDAELAALAPKCELSGRCCNFKESGHTLFATDLELQWLARTTPHRVDGDPELCPHWRNGLCEAREGRPLGCRLYFCDASKQAELEELSLRYHARLKRLHETNAVAYSYGPFLAKVRASTATDRERARRED